MGGRKSASEDRDPDSGVADRVSTTRSEKAGDRGTHGVEPGGIERLQQAVGNRAIQRAARGRDDDIQGNPPADRSESGGQPAGPGEEAENAPSTGTGLPAELKRAAESAGGVSLDDVSVEYDSPRPARYRARAFARGSDIYLGPGGQQHLPEETWHVVQQKQGRVRATGAVAGEPLNSDPALEREAKRSAAMLPTGIPSKPSGRPAGGPADTATTRRGDPQTPIQRVTEGEHVPLNVQQGNSCWMYVIEALLRNEGVDTTRLRRVMKSYPDEEDVEQIVADQSWMEDYEDSTSDPYTLHTRQDPDTSRYRSRASVDNVPDIATYPFADTQGRPHFERDPDKPWKQFPSYFGDLKLAEMKLHNAQEELVDRVRNHVSVTLEATGTEAIGVTVAHSTPTTISVQELRRVFRATVGTDRPVEEFSTVQNQSTGRNPHDTEAVDVAYAFTELERTIRFTQWLQARTATEDHTPRDAPEGLTGGDETESHLGELAPRSFLSIRATPQIAEFAARLRKMAGPPVMAVIYRRPDDEQYAVVDSSEGAEQTQEYPLGDHLVDAGRPPQGATTSQLTHAEPRYTVDLRATAPNGPEVRRTDGTGQPVRLATPIQSEDAPHVVVVSKVNVSDDSIHYIDPNYGSDVEFVVSYTEFLEWGTSGENSHIVSINTVR